MGWIEVKSVWLDCPYFADAFEGREALEDLQPPPIIVGVDEVVEMRRQLNSAYPVGFTEWAIDDFAGISLWIAGRADKDVAHAYVERLKAIALRLGGYPRGGTPRDEFAPGLRSVTFERRVIVAYRVEDGAVHIVRLIHAARDLGRALGND